MKIAERILGIAGTSLLILGFFFKSQHWPGASVMVVLAVFIFNFGYLPLLLHIQWRESVTRLQKFYSVYKFFALFCILLGFIFKVMHWPGANIGLRMGNILLPVYILLYFYMRLKKQGKLPFMLRDLLITAIAYAIFIFISITSVSMGVVEGYRLLEDQYLKMNEGLASANRMIFESIDSVMGKGDGGITGTENEGILGPVKELRALGQDYFSGADSIKEGFYRMILGPFYTPGTGHLSLNLDILADNKPVQEYFIKGGNATRIKALVDGYRESAEEILRSNNLSQGAVGVGLQTEDVIDPFGQQSWISYIFERVPTGSVIINLSLLKQMVLLTENTLLNSLVGQADLSGEARMLQELAARESEKAIQLKENEITRVKQQQELQAILLEQSQMVIKQNRMMAIFAFAGAGLVLVLFSISTRAYVRKQRDNRKLAEQKVEITEKNEELNQQNEEIAAQRDEIEAQRDLVFKQKEQIERTHGELSSSIDYATRLQTSILPGTGLLEEKFSDHFVFFRPKHRVSGDFYWWTLLEDKVVIAAADCTGHGVPGAFMSMLGVSLLRETVNKEYITRPAIILQHLRKEVIRSLGQKGELGEQKDGMDLALVSIHTDSLMCEYAGANSPLYLVRGGELTEYKPDRMPVSFYQRMDKFSNREIQLEKGDQLYLFSDGYADQFGGENRKKFKYKAFQQLLLDHCGEPMEQQKQALVETILRWQGEYEQIDDMVIVGIRI